jgi:transcriptional regulator with XRE-family HTH domain
MGTIRAGRPSLKISALIAATRGDRTQSELARDAGMSVQGMQQYVAGAYPATNFPDSRTLRGLARACKVDVRTIIRATEETLAEALGIDAADRGPTLTELLPPEAAYLGDETIGAIRALIVTAGRPAMMAASVRAAAESAATARAQAEAALNAATRAASSDEADGDPAVKRRATRARAEAKAAMIAATQARASIRLAADATTQAQAVIDAASDAEAASAAAVEAAEKAQGVLDAPPAVKPAKSSVKPAKRATRTPSR